MLGERLRSSLDGDDERSRTSQIRAFETIFVLILATEYWARAIPKWGQFSAVYAASLAAASVLCAAALLVSWRRAAFAGLAATQAVVLWREFPAAGNHAYLELYLCALCAFLDPRVETDQRLLIRSVRWLVCVIFFFGGVQKIAHGYYTYGQYFAYSLGTTPSFRPVLRPFLPDAEYARLIAYKGQPGDGPYLVADAQFVALSNAVYVVEIALAGLLFARKTRVAGVAAALAFVAGIELAAREVFFGLVLSNAVLLFLPSDTNRRLVPAFAALLVALLAARLGWLPEVTFY